MKIAFDIGMYDGADTAYCLESGYKVIAVEANPNLAEMGRSIFASPISRGELEILNVAISDSPETVNLTVCGTDLGSSSIFADRLTDRYPIGSYTVPAVTFADLIAKHGRPDFVKVDIEGADKLCVLALIKETAPAYLSFEAPAEFEQMVGHAAAIGYSRFKVINQCNFLSLQRQECLSHRMARKIIRTLGYDEPLLARRSGRYFKLGHSSGPGPWESDGKWYSASEIIRDWHDAVRTEQTTAWYDVHAAR